jgi:hypothetical protein
VTPPRRRADVPRWLRDAYRIDLMGLSPTGSNLRNDLLSAVALGEHRARAIFDSQQMWHSKAMRHALRRDTIVASAQVLGWNSANEQQADEEHASYLEAELNAVRGKNWPGSQPLAHVKFVGTLLVETPWLPLEAIEHLAWWKGFTKPRAGLQDGPATPSTALAVTEGGAPSATH